MTEKISPTAKTSGPTWKLKFVSLNVTKLPTPVVMLFSGSTMMHAIMPPINDKQHGFEEEAEQDAAARKAENAKRADLFGAARNGCVHGVHGRETTAHGHDDANEEAEELNRGGAAAVCEA